MELTLGEQLRNYVFVRDIASTICSLLSTEGELAAEINLYSRHNLSLRQFGTLFADQFEHRGTLDWGSRPYREDEIMHNYADNSTPVLINPCNIETALAETVEINGMFADV